MAGTDERKYHQRIRELIHGNIEGIGDKELFSSEILRNVLRDIALSTSKRFKYGTIDVQLPYDPSKDAAVAYTDSDVVTINAGSSLVQKGSRENKYMAVIGLLCHEIGHCLFTDFKKLNAFQSAIKAGQWYPEKPIPENGQDASNLKKLDDLLQKPRTNLADIFHTLQNILEDAYIEYKICTYYPGNFASGLNLVNERLLDSCPELGEMKKNGSDKAQMFSQIFLTYAKFGKIKCDSTYGVDEKDVLDRLISLFPIIDKGIYEESQKARLQAANVIIMRTWDFFEQDKPKTQPRKKQSEKGQPGNGQSGNGQSGNGQPGNGQPGNGQPGNGQSQNPIAGIAGQSVIPKGYSGTVKKQSEEKAGSKKDASQSENKVKKEREKTKRMLIPQEKNTSDGKKVLAASEKETGRLLARNTTEIKTNGEGKTIIDKAYEGSKYPYAASEIERMLKTMAMNQTTAMLESERVQQLNVESGSIDYGRIHRNANVTIHRETAVTPQEQSQYQLIAPKLLYVSKQLQKMIQQKVKDQRIGGKLTNLTFGRRIEARNLFRDDGKYFSKQKLPENVPQLAISVLYDESGSMRSKDRITAARATAIVLYDFCSAMQIPISIYGHNAYRQGVNLYSYAEFDKIDECDKYRLVNIVAHNASNRDGMALRYSCEKLLKRPEQQKIMILVSDGQPNDTGYHGTAAFDDLRQIKREYKRKGIKLIAAAIGDDKQIIQNIYGDGFLDISNFSTFPADLTKLIIKQL